MLGMNREDLAKNSGVSARAIADFEADKRKPIRATMAALQRALEDAGVEFTNGDQPGVRLAKNKKAKR
ncbi:MAG TPA: helix-turn-helix transcriptional regulator [Rhizomicrobium sp.]|jgi:transcriptional regulator with XRE-family HTH domain|nr:helix-turn-helix transcriptional regulator [Rhizomicrobium sp.]